MNFHNLTISRNNFLAIAYSLIPLGLMIGPFISDLLIVSICVIFLIEIYKNKKLYYFNNFYFKIFMIWWFYILLRSIFSQHILLSLESSLFYFRFGLISLCCYYLLNEFPKFINYFIFLTLFAFGFLLFDSYFQLIFGYDIFGNIYNPNRMTALFGEERVLGSYLSRLFPLVFSFVFLFKKNTKKILFLSIIFFVLTDVIVFLSGDRSSFFYLTLFSFIIIFLINDFRYIRVISFIISIIVIFLISNFNENIKNRMFVQTVNQLNLNPLNQSEKFLDKNSSEIDTNKNRLVIFSSGHEQIYNTALLIIRDNFLFGIGPKNFRISCKIYVDQFPEGCSSQPHNTYLQIFAETGVVGFLFISTILLLVLYLLFKQFFTKLIYKNIFLSNYQICLLIAILITLWPIIPTGNFFNNWLSAIYFLPVGFLIKSFDKSKNI